LRGDALSFTFFHGVACTTKANLIFAALFFKFGFEGIVSNRERGLSRKTRKRPQ
jgi:hypothetical protein